eukprot:TRINITY_DN103210_c0_g1_i1.p1 TRINITY_DN103210_c0_g1~~TRINITY_DN103210_c0_g1_i1.p1  ORF type:complete len:505 (-),score=82.49 TRINITY_DN103210_c0_g1_i1:338-1753(-)
MTRARIALAVMGAIGAAGGSAPLVSPLVLQASLPYETLFEEFIRKYHKNYTAEERPLRFDAFRENVDFMRDHNTKNHTFEVSALTPFADLTTAEFAQRNALRTIAKTGKLQSFWGDLPILESFDHLGVDAPDSVDWRGQGVVTSVKNQGQCGACWTFAATGAIEGAWAIATKQLISLSEQQILDCSGQANGCHGGSPINAIQYDTKEDICTESSYQYYAAQGSCQARSCSVGIPSGGVTGARLVRPGDEKALLAAVAMQPVAVAINANTQAFQLYTGGILKSGCGTSVDHGVLLVGYGTDGGTPYWLVKNSWSPQWGESGYVRIIRGVGGYGECAILTEPILAAVNGDRMLWYYSVPWGLVCLGIVAVVGLGCWAGCYIKRICVQRRMSSGQQTTTARTLLLDTGSNGRRLGTAPAAAPSRTLQVPALSAQQASAPPASAPPAAFSGAGQQLAEAKDHRAGNSRASRLLQG